MSKGLAACLGLWLRLEMTSEIISHRPMPTVLTHTIVASLRLEKTSRILRSNPHPMPTKSCCSHRLEEERAFPRHLSQPAACC